jgi:hypothetical protein
MMSRPLKPTPELVSHYIEKFDESGAGATDRALTELLNTFPGNHQFEHILIKVVTINALYATGIMAVGALAASIQRHNIDEQLAEGNPDLVNTIAPLEVKPGKFRRNYSFASKYCSWHKPEAYPIFDSFVENLLWQYQQIDRFSGFARHHMVDYPKYRQIIEAFREGYHLVDYSFKDLDKFLWMYGKEYAESLKK